MPIVSLFTCGQDRLAGVKQVPKSARVGYFNIDNQEDRTSNRLLRADMAVRRHRMEGDMQTFTLVLPAYYHSRRFRGRGHYHAGAYLYRRRHRVTVCGARLETPGGD